MKTPNIDRLCIGNVPPSDLSPLLMADAYRIFYILLLVNFLRHIVRKACSVNNLQLNNETYVFFSQPISDLELIASPPHSSSTHRLFFLLTPPTTPSPFLGVCSLFCWLSTVFFWNEEVLTLGIMKFFSSQW
ncbi:hypothetical protein V6Z12_A07G112800 [Gossypium hirsutum]